MTDKSFGDHMNRNIVKNPLLSSAVTGLSIEDLTYNAVLLPVSQAQELITRPDQIGAQDRSLSNTDNAITNYPSGDTNANLYIPPNPATTTPNLLDSPQMPECQNSPHDRPSSTLSKASVKSTDDFDVNEYFARLQGTRYVSAPLNSQIKEDANANLQLQATEENLEEINLNEEKPEVETQSFTSDIAQNFSQLPTVLPQVASAVFSSFSNMLNMKSKDTTPEVAPPPPVSQDVYQIDQKGHTKENVQLMGVAQFAEVREVGMPPKEPPVVGTSNYRLPTKKKYAQIPGLSSGDKAQIPSYNPPIQTNVPSYFVPESQTQNQGSQNYGNFQASIADNTFSVALNQPYNVDEARTVASQKDNQVSYDMFNPGTYKEMPKDYTDSIAVTNRTGCNIANAEADKYQVLLAQERPELKSANENYNYAPNISLPPQNIESSVQAQSTSQNHPPQENTAATVPNLGVIPPPPMFSNAPRRDSTPNSGVGRTILPPSVARRIGANHPVLKPKTQAVPFVENIFVPVVNPEETKKAEITNFQQTLSAFAPYTDATSTAISSTNITKVDSNVSKDNITSMMPSSFGSNMVPPSLISSVVPPNNFGSTMASTLPPPPKNVNLCSMVPPSFGSTMTSTLPPPPKSLPASSVPPSFGSTMTAPPPKSATLTLPPPPKTISLTLNAQKLEAVAPPPMFSKTSGAPYGQSASASKDNSAPPMMFSSSDFQSTVPSNIFQSSQIFHHSSHLDQETVAPPPMFLPSSFPTSTSFPAPQGQGTPITQQFGTNFGPPPTLFNPGTSETANSQGPSIFTPPTTQQVTKYIPPSPSFFNPGTKTANVEDSSKPENLPPPPVFFNPNTMQVTATHILKTDNIYAISQPGTSDSEPLKMAEPPKVAGNLNYRMTKKKPQYYAGPISGVGDISNNVKPVIQQPETNVFQGALFTPTPVQEEVVSQSIPGLNQASVPFIQGVPINEQYAPGIANQNQPFDISRPAENVSTFTSIGKYPENIPNQDYNTVFDVSRPATDIYEPPKEQKSFGIIGSIKSKLSSIDINKIQSSVTTFFDPSYNDGKNKNETSGEHYNSTTYMPSFEHYAHSQANDGANIEVFVPNVGQHPQSYNYNPQNPIQSHEQQKFQTQYLYSHYPNQGQNYPPFSYYTEDKQATSMASSYTFIDPIHTTSSGYRQNVSSSDNPQNFTSSDYPQNVTSSDYPLNDTSSDNQQNVSETTASQISVAETVKSEHASFIAKESNTTQHSAPQTTEDVKHTKDIGQDLNKANDAKLCFETQPPEPQSVLPQSSISFGNTEQKLNPVFGQSSSNISSGIPLQIPREIPSQIPQNTQEIENLKEVLQENTSSLKLSDADLFVTPKSNVQLDTISAKNFFDMPPTQYSEDLSSHGNINLKGASEKSEEFDPKHSDISSYSSIQASGYDLKENLESYSENLPSNTLYSSFGKEENFIDDRSVSYDNPDGTATNLIKMIENVTKCEKKNNLTQYEDSSTPLSGLSTMLANKSKELADLEHDMENMNIQDSRNIDTIFNRGLNVSFFDVSKAKNLDDSQESTNHKTCETCREVNPTDKTYDLTKQLIENITSPIQLSNPVEVPLSESDSDVRLPEEVDVNQLEEISHITEETIETIQVQSATELLDDNFINEGNYGWCPDKSILSITNVSEHDYTLQIPPQAIGFVSELDCTSQVPPNPIEFLSGSLFSESYIPSIPRNASDELKAEFKCHEESPNSSRHEFKSHEEKPILSRQMSIPTAPPIEDVEKLDETIDVHSIEQDASKDFPGEELIMEPSETKGFLAEEFIIEPSEFIIEPSETDDDKIEYRERGNSNAAETQDEIESFTSRVEKFKQMDQIVNEVIEKTSPILGLSATSPSLPIASYFDTGNYAADTHYKNLSSPNFGQFNIGSPPQMRVPPGFEEEYQNRLIGLNPVPPSGHKPAVPQSTLPLVPPSGLVPPIRNDPKPEIPDTSTQTRPTFSPTFTSVQCKYENTTTGFTVPKMTDSVQENSYFADRETFPEFDLFGPKTGKTILPLAAIVNPNIMSEEVKRLDIINTERDLLLTPDASNVFGAIKKETNIPHRLDTFSELTKQKEKAEDDYKQVIPDIFGVGEEELPKGHSETFSAFRQEPMKVTTKVDKPEHLETLSALRQDIKVPSKPDKPEHSETLAFRHDSMKATTKVDKPDLAKIQDPDLARFQDPVTFSGFRQEPMKVDKPELAKLQDPMNFFSAETAVYKEDGSSRLASYFAAPSQGPSKSFFELSQGQDHYRQNPKLDIGNKNQIPDKKPEDAHVVSQNENYSQNTFNIPQNQYIANLNLIKDLTSPQNLQIDTDKNVKIVNYFTVEYDNENPLINESNIGEPEHQKKLNFKCNNKDYLIDQETDEKTLNTIINKCKYCCDFGHGHIETYFNVDHENINLFDFNYKVRKYTKSDIHLPDFNHKGRRCMNSEKDKSEVKTDKVDKMDSKADKSQSVTLTFDEESMGNENESNEGVGLGTESRTSTEYSPVNHHWFYRVDVEGKSIWRGFSLADSQALEQAYHSPELNEETRVATDGGRFDVNIIGRLRIPVYWQDKPTNVRRCSWFYKGTTDARYVPYTEAVAEKLEEEFRHGMTTGEWHRRLVLPSNELVVMHTPKVMVHFLQSDDAFSSPIFAFGKRVYRAPLRIRVSRDQVEKVDHLVFMVHGAGEYRHQKEREKVQSTMRPRVVRRGHDESEIEDFEPSNIDHLLLLCHGVGSTCDMRFRSVEEVVDDFRTTSLQLLQSHYKNSYESGVVGRVEVLPISWHATLHSGETGVDRRLARVTLDSIPRLRNFTNDTVLDVLFYTSPVFCQTIIDTVCSELNRIYKLFCSRNPNFSGGVSLGGHSLGSVILYDLLGNQINEKDQGQKTPKQFVPNLPGTGEHTVKYPKLNFKPVALYALGSPIAIFECIRGVEALGPEFKLPTCRNFFNIFHPYDPIAYRIEPLINGQLKNVKPQLIPHHKGRKRMHLELKDTMARVGADIKQKLVESIKSTWSNVWRTQPPHRQLEKVVEEEIEREQLNQRSDTKDEQNQIDDDTQVTPEMLGKLNNGRRVDYVLQEAPFEMINEYLFAMSSHVCYWESEDTMLLMLREIYDSLGVQPDSTVPQPNMTVQRDVDQTVVTNMEIPSTSRGPT